MRAFITVVLLAASLQIVGCDSKTATEQNLDELVDIGKKQNAIFLEQLDSGEALMPDSDHMEKMAEKIDEIADGLSGQEALDVRDQADAIRDMQVMVAPYMTALQTFIELGGIEAGSFKVEQSYGERLVLVETLMEQNEIMDQEFPALQRRIQAGSVLTAQIIGLASQIRQTDRVLFPHMKSYIKILRDNHGLFEVNLDGELIFDESADDSMIEALNLHVDQINIISSEQAELQRALVMLTQP